MKDAPVYITEGPFDSTFIRNAIAMCGSDVHADRGVYRDIVWVYDNEPRNVEIVKRIKRTIDQGDPVVIWPKSISQKDINDMVLNRIPDIIDVINNNTMQGLSLNLAINNWSKV